MYYEEMASGKVTFNPEPYYEVRYMDLLSSRIISIIYGFRLKLWKGFCLLHLILLVHITSVSFNVMFQWHIYVAFFLLHIMQCYQILEKLLFSKYSNGGLSWVPTEYLLLFISLDFSLDFFNSKVVWSSTQQIY